MKRSNVVAAVSILCVSSVSAPALADSWNIHQSNGFDATFKIDRAGDRLTGTAFYVLGGSRIVNGVVEGKCFNGADLDFTVRWDNGSAGHYTGTIGSDGFVRNGRTADVNNGPTKEWSSTTAVRLGSAGAGAVKPTLTVQAVPNQLQNGFEVRLGGSGFRAGEAVVVNYRSVTQGTATPWSRVGLRPSPSTRAQTSKPATGAPSPSRPARSPTSTASTRRTASPMMS